MVPLRDRHISYPCARPSAAEYRGDNLPALRYSLCASERRTWRHQAAHRRFRMVIGSNSIGLSASCDRHARAPESRFA
jgi:hypothetical protein